MITVFIILLGTSGENSDGPIVDFLLMHDLHHDTDTTRKILMDSYVVSCMATLPEGSESYQCCRNQWSATACG